MVITSQTKKRSPQERKLLKNRKKAHKVPIGVISHFFTVIIMAKLTNNSDLA